LTKGKPSKAPEVIFAASLFTAGFWLTAQLVDVYYYAVGGAVFELLWLPMILAIFVLPAVAFVYWIMAGFRIKSLHFYSLVLLLAVGLFIYSNN